MKTLILLILVILSACDHHETPRITREHIEQIKKVATFETYDYEEHPFKDATESELLAALGLKGLPFEDLPQLPEGDLSVLPTNFNSRDKWPQCIHQIRDEKSVVHAGHSLLLKSYQIDSVLPPTVK
jgi:hypothetical protein